MTEPEKRETRAVDSTPEEYKATIGGSLAELEHEVDELICDAREFVSDKGDENSDPSGSPTRIRLELLVHKVKKLRADLDT